MTKFISYKKMILTVFSIICSAALAGDNDKPEKKHENVRSENRLDCSLVPFALVALQRNEHVQNEKNKSLEFDGELVYYPCSKKIVEYIYQKGSCTPSVDDLCP